jgi:hypothetical protein
MYSFDALLEGVKYTVYLFSTFGGIIQPFTPQEPITAEEIYTRNFVKYLGTSYIQAWYVEEKDGPRMMILKKIFLIAEPFDKTLLPKITTPGPHYYRIYKNGSDIKVGNEITAMDTINEIHFLRIVINAQGMVDSSLRVYNDAYHINKYNYDDRGVLQDWKVEAKKELEKIPDL